MIIVQIKIQRYRPQLSLLTACWLKGVLEKADLCPDITGTWMKIQIKTDTYTGCIQTEKDTSSDKDIGIYTTADDADNVLVDRGTGEVGFVS